MKTKPSNANIAHWNLIMKNIIITINDDWNNDIIVDFINYWHKEFQLTKNDENVFFNSNGWLNNQHLVAAMNMLFIQKL
jgi:hypothetical protein